MAKIEWVIGFNSTDSSIVVDEEGHSIDPHSWAPVDKKYTKEHIHEGRILVVDPETLNDKETDPTVMMVHKEVQRLNSEQNKSSKASKAN